MGEATCLHGHPKTPENTRPRNRGCAVCHRDQERERNRAKGAKPRRRIEDIDACSNGHPFPENLRPGRNDCAVCHRDRERTRYRSNPEPQKKAATEWMRKNKERRDAYYAAYREANIERLREYARDNMRRRSLGRDEAAYAYSEILRSDPCSYCGGPAGTIDHIEPVSRGGSNEWTNLTAACRDCNSKKRTRSLLKFMLATSA